MHIELDPAVAQHRKRQRTYRLQVIEIPRLRLLGMSILVLSMLFHHLFIAPTVPWRTLMVVGGCFAGYSLLSWLILYFGYQRISWCDLSLVFLITDIVLFLVTLYYTGAEQSWLVFLLSARVADQAHVRFTRALFFVHLTTAGYLLLVLYVAYGEQRPVVWPEVWTKLVCLHLINLYIAFTARTAEGLRNRTRAAIRLARELIMRLEEQARQLGVEKTRAEEASQAKSVFLTNMSHELRTPLNGVLGMTEMVLRTSLTPAQQASLRVVQDSGYALLHLLNDVLDFANTASGQSPLEIHPFALRQMLEQSCAPLLVQAQHKGLALHYSVQPDVPDALLGDSQRLSQILHHLLGNAIKFTRAGSITVDVRHDALDTTLVHFAIADTGPGISPEKHQAIFAAFVQADDSLTRAHGGVGLGLAIAQQLVTMMGGRIWVESSPQHGSTFHFTARLLAASAPPAALAAALAASSMLQCRRRP